MNSCENTLTNEILKDPSETPFKVEEVAGLLMKIKANSSDVDNISVLEESVNKEESTTKNSSRKRLKVQYTEEDVLKAISRILEYRESPFDCNRATIESMCREYQIPKSTLKKKLQLYTLNNGKIPQHGNRKISAEEESRIVEEITMLFSAGLRLRDCDVAKIVEDRCKQMNPGSEINESLQLGRTWYSRVRKRFKIIRDLDAEKYNYSKLASDVLECMSKNNVEQNLDPAVCSQHIFSMGVCEFSFLKSVGNTVCWKGLDRAPYELGDNQISCSLSMCISADGKNSWPFFSFGEKMQSTDEDNIVKYSSTIPASLAVSSSGLSSGSVFLEWSNMFLEYLNRTFGDRHKSILLIMDPPDVCGALHVDALKMLRDSSVFVVFLPKHKVQTTHPLFPLFRQLKQQYQNIFDSMFHPNSLWLKTVDKWHILDCAYNAFKATTKTPEVCQSSFKSSPFNPLATDHL